MRGYRTLVLPALLSAGGFLLAGLAASPSPQLSALGDDGRSIVRHAAGVVGWLALAWFGGRLFDLVITRRMLTAVEAARHPRLLGDLVRALLFGLAFIAILVYVFEGAAVGLVATSSVLIAVVGFALRSILADVFSGIALNFERPYRLGDWIEVGPGMTGRVTDIDWRATQVQTRDGLTVTVPNGLIAGSRLVNYSHPQPDFRTSVQVALDASVPFGRAKRLLLAGALEAERAFPGLRPDVLLQTFGDAGPVYALRFWISDYAQENACRDAVLAGVLASLASAGLSPAYAKREIAVTRGRLAPGKLAREELLASIAFFASFDASERSLIAESMSEHHLRRGAVVVEEGDAGDSLFVLAEGALDVSILGPEGAAHAVDRLLAGDIFGEMSLLTGNRRSATVTAATDVLFYEIRKAHLDPILRARPALAESLAAMMKARRRHNTGRLSEAGPREPSGGPQQGDDLLSRLKSFFGLVSSA